MERQIKIAGLFVFLITAWFSAGYFHPDEHFQLLEPANLILGRTPDGDLAWEFDARIRPALQPLIAAAEMGFLNAAGLDDPFIQTALLRMLSGLAAWLLYAAFARRLAPEFSDSGTVRYLFGACIFLWFMPFLSVRFSSENWSGLSFLAALYLILYGEKRPFRYAAAGVLLGAAFFFRFQIAFAAIGLGAWLLYYRRLSVSAWAALCLGGFAGLALGFTADRWFYGEWVFTPWAYFDQNILQHKAENYGVEPWWYYFSATLEKAVPPLSLLLLGGLLSGLYQKRQHVFSWVFAAFLLGHTFVSHKELRFMYPMLFPVLFLTVSGLEPVARAWMRGRAVRFLVYITLTINALLWLYGCTQPQGMYIPYFRYIACEARQKPVQLWVEKENPYRLVGLQSHVYTPPNVQVRVVDDFSGIQLPAGRNTDSTYLLLHRRLRFDAPPPFPVQPVYRYLPEWLMDFNFNHWQERSNIWSIYRF